MTDEIATDANAGASSRILGEPPWFPNVAEVMDPAPDLLDDLVTEFAPLGAQLSTQSTWWLTFHFWAVDKLVAEEMSPDVTAERDLRQSVWIVYSSAYWAMLELQLNFGVPAAVLNLGMTPEAPTESSVAGFAVKLAARQRALEPAGEGPLKLAHTILHEEPTTGLMHGAAYNTGYLEVISEPPPLGQRPSHFPPETGAIRVNPRDFMRIDYDRTVPPWLKEWRTAFEVCARADPDSLERIIVGRGTDKNLRTMWSEALAWGHNNWGTQSTSPWTKEYFDDCLQWTTVFNFGLEAVALASLVALMTDDEAVARRAIRANAVVLGSWGAAVMGLLDTGGQLPKVVRSS